MQDPYLNSVLEAIASAALDAEGPHLISEAELRAAGALDVPPAWRKSLGGQPEQRDLFSNLADDDDTTREPDEPSDADAV